MSKVYWKSHDQMHTGGEVNNLKFLLKYDFYTLVYSTKSIKIALINVWAYSSVG